MEIIGQDSDLKQAYINAAISLRKGGLNSDALKLVRKARQIGSHDPSTHVLIGLIHQEMGETEQAEKSFRKAIKVAPDDSDALKSLGLFLISQDRKEEGLIRLLEYIKKDNWDDITIIETIVSIAKEISQEEVTTPVLKQAWENSLSTRIGFQYGRHLRYFERYDQAIPIIELIANHTKYHEHFNELGIIYTHKKMYAEAITAYQLAIKNIENYEYEDDEELFREMDIAEANLGIYYGNLAYAYQAAEQFEMAFEAAEKGIKEDPFSAFIWEQKVSALMKLSRFEETSQAAGEAIERLKTFENEDLEDLRIYQIQALEKMKKNDKALDVLENARINYPKQSFFYFRAADLLERERRFEEAAKVLETAFRSLDWPEFDTWEGTNFSHYLGSYYILLSQIEGLEISWQKFEPLFIRSPYVAASITFSLLFMLDGEDPDNWSRVIQISDFLFSKLPEDPWIIRLMFILGFVQDNIERTTQILKEAMQLELSNEYHLSILNNLGYLYLLQGKLIEAEQIFVQALGKKNSETYETSKAETELGVAFYLGGKILDGNWFYSSFSYSQKSPYWQPKRIITAIQCNLITLALAKGDLHEANKVALGLIKQVSDPFLDPTIMSLIFLSRYKDDPIAARLAWQLLPESLRKDYIGEENLKLSYPEFFDWLIEAGGFA